MFGRITKFKKELGYGVIATKNGERYRFKQDSVVNVNGKLVGHEVDFELSGRKPTDIILMTGTPWDVFNSRQTD